MSSASHAVRGDERPRRASRRQHAGGGDARGATMAPLAVRVAMMVLAAALAAVCALAAWNAHIAGAFNGATATLEANMAAAQAEDADLDALATTQRQVDAQFADLTGSSAAQWPGLRDAVRANADASAALSADLARRIAERDTRSNAANLSDSDQPSGSGGSGNQGDGADADATDRKLEELLAQNEQQSASGKQRDSTDDSTGGQDSDVKPW